MYFACSKLQTSRLVVIITITTVRFHYMAFPIDNSLNFFDHLNDFKCDEVIIGGDFNLVLDLDTDKKRRLRQNTYRTSENTERFLRSN